MSHAIARLLAEFIGTFFLVVVIGMTALDPDLPRGLASLAVAAILAALIFALGHVSGAHFNPIVTLAFVVRRALPPRETIPFIATQFAAAVLSVNLCLWLTGSHDPSDPIAAPSPLDLQTLPAAVLETLFTFALVTVILNVALSRRGRSEQVAGIAVGAVVLAGSYVAGPVSGAAFNPAVTIALGTMGIAVWTDVWIHFAGQIAGGLLALAVFAVTEPPNPSD